MIARIPYVVLALWPCLLVSLPDRVGRRSAVGGRFPPSLGGTGVCGDGARAAGEPAAGRA